MSKILRNAAKCLDCDEVIESTHRHDFKYCKGRHIFVDGGLSYIRRGWTEMARMEDLSEFEEEEDVETAGERSD